MPGAQHPDFPAEESCGRTDSEGLGLAGDAVRVAPAEDDHMNALHPDAANPSHDPVRVAPCVLLVSADDPRRREIEQLLRRIEPDCRLLIESGVIDALLAVTLARADLVLIDAGLGAGVAALTRHLTHLTPAATVLIFDSSVPPVASPGEWSWGEAPAVCAQWFQHFRMLGRTNRNEPEEGGKA